MKARKRFLLLFVAFLALIHFGINRFKNTFRYFDLNLAKNESKIEFQNNFYEIEKTFYSLKPEISVNRKQNYKSEVNGPEVQNDCRMSSCFDLKKCLDLPKNGLKVHFYPNFGENSQKLSQSFGKIIEIIKTSNYYETDPNKACLFMSTIWDTLDRDPLSREFQKSYSSMTSFEPLFGGRNHLVFNLYSGSWPQYRQFDFQYSNTNNHNSNSNSNYGKIGKILKNAILVKASQSRDTYRPDFDVSLPLFARNHPLRGPPFISHESQQNYYPTQSHIKSNIKQIWDKKRINNNINNILNLNNSAKYLLVFKGKRYIYGIGSETRNSLHYLNNGRDVLILTTCRHGKRWREMKDEKCETDNQSYDKYDYQQLMANSTFCLVPRGRRLGSYRFLEALSVGCIPVVLSNGWVLPFQEIIDWSGCVVTADERLLLQIPETLRSIGEHKIEVMRHKCLALYSTYFSSVERIVMTSLVIIEQRISSHISIEHFVWNLVTPGMSSLVSQSQLGVSQSANQNNYLLLDECSANSAHSDLDSDSTNGFTAIIHVTRAQDVSMNLQKLVQKTIAFSVSARETIIFWSILAPIPHYLIKSKRIRIIREKNIRKEWKLIGNHVTTNISTKAVFQLSPNSLLTSEELEFAFSVWKSFPLRLIGFSSRDHYYNDDKHIFEYSSKWTNQYSMVLLDAAIYHKVYNTIFTNYFHSNQLFSDWLRDYDVSECADLAFAFLISHITREGPLKLSGRKRTISCPNVSWLEWSERNTCFARLQQLFGYLPLIQSNVRLDPLLYKDQVAIRRKKFRKMETIEDNSY